MKLPDVLILALCLTGTIPSGLSALSTQVPASPAPASQTPASKTPPPPPHKMPAEPIDPDATAGVRGPGYAIKVQVRFMRKPVAGAYVLARNPNSSVAGTCNTNSTGICILSIGTGDYTFTATQNGLTGNTSAQVAATTKELVIKLAKVK